MLLVKELKNAEDNFAEEVMSQVKVTKRYRLKMEHMSVSIFKN